jgi:hypothetical protein
MVRSILIATLAFCSLCVKAQFKSTVTFLNKDETSLHVQMEDNLSLLMTEFNAAFVEKRQLNWSGIQATDEARARIDALWLNGNFRCFDTELSENLIRAPGGAFQVRNIPLIITTSEGSPATEEAVINLNASGLIDDLYFGIEQHRYKSVMQKGSSVKDFRRRQMILDFLENFRTAYNRKDIDIIEKTFSENALIIKGQVLQAKTDGPDYMRTLGKERVELIRYNKQEYMQSLRSVFARNGFIDVRFDDVEVVKHGTLDHLYGVNLRQQWRSTTYGDEGWLFLLIDFEDETRPLIHVRAWQPTRHTQKEEAIELGDFDLVK